MQLNAFMVIQLNFIINKGILIKYINKKTVSPETV